MTTDCLMLICDEWLQLTFEDPGDVIELLKEAHCLRRSIQRALDLEIAELFEAECDDDVPEELAESEVELPPSAPVLLRRALRAPVPILRRCELEDRALRFWHCRVHCKWQTL